MGYSSKNVLHYNLRFRFLTELFGVEVLPDLNALRMRFIFGDVNDNLLVARLLQEGIISLTGVNLLSILSGVTSREVSQWPSTSLCTRTGSLLVASSLNFSPKGTSEGTKLRAIKV